MLVLFSATVVALLLTDAVRRIAFRLQWLDIPGIGRVHAKPVPRIGGLAIFAAFTGTFLVAIWLLEDLTFDTKYLGLLLGAGLITLVMFIDDVRGLPPLPKFVAQIVAAGIAISFGIYIEFVRDPFGGKCFLSWMARRIHGRPRLLSLLAIGDCHTVLDRRHDECH